MALRKGGGCRMDVWEVPCSSCPGLDRGSLMEVRPKHSRLSTALMTARGFLTRHEARQCWAKPTTVSKRLTRRNREAVPDRLVFINPACCLARLVSQRETTAGE